MAKKKEKREVDQGSHGDAQKKKNYRSGELFGGTEAIGRILFFSIIQAAQEQIIRLMMLMILMMMMMMMMMMMIRKVKTRLQIWMSPLLPLEVSNKLSTPIKRK